MGERFFTTQSQNVTLIFNYNLNNSNVMIQFTVSVPSNEQSQIRQFFEEIPQFCHPDLAANVRTGARSPTEKILVYKGFHQPEFRREISNSAEVEHISAILNPSFENLSLNENGDVIDIDNISLEGAIHLYAYSDEVFWHKGFVGISSSNQQVYPITED
jgi:hypothetical protein